MTTTTPNGSSATSTATVETLAAEVRVLMVGNRQVTLSVAKQLDSFSTYEDESLNFEPFGRIRTGTKGETNVRCKSTDKGAEWYPIPGIKFCDAYQKQLSCGHTRGTVRGVHACGWYERYEPREYHFEWIGRHTPTGALIVIQAYLGDDGLDDEFASWRELPLIVLAGLR
jgi:hypothetical protein